MENPEERYRLLGKLGGQILYRISVYPEFLGSKKIISPLTIGITQLLRRSTKFLFSVFNFVSPGQEEMIDSILMLRDLIQFPNKVSFFSSVFYFSFSL